MDEFLKGYLVCALWSSNDESTPDGGNPLDQNYGIEDISEEAMAKMKADCEKFVKLNGHLLTEENFIGRREGSLMGYAGHDFWLTRNHHGAGFWDGDWKKEVGEKLTTSAHTFGEIDLFVNDDGKIYLM